MDDARRVALYARVSSQRQAEEATIDSQVAALLERIAADGVPIDAVQQFLDNGYSGSTLIRPALERLRDVMYLDAIDRLYVHAPDRLARNYLHQAVLLEEFHKRQVEVVFLNQPRTESSSEGNLLLHMQGVIAEYEREKILERTRRGRRHAAQRGQVSALGQAPYGYRYVTRRDGHGEARYEVVPEEARVVGELFRWVGVEGLSLHAAARRLAEHGIPTRTGRPYWKVTTVRGMLINPAYRGEAHFGKSRLEPRTTGRQRRRGQPDVPRKEKVVRLTPESEHEVIAVPALVSPELFAAVAERLAENRLRYRTRVAGPRFLLSGLLVCGRCGSAYCGRTHKSGDRRQEHVYYRCLATDKRRYGGEAPCDNLSIGRSSELAVWADVCELLANPQRVRRELERRGQPSPSPADADTKTAIARLREQLERVLDLYQMGCLEKAAFVARFGRLKERLSREEQAQAEQQQATRRWQEQADLLDGFERFAAEIRAGLAQADLATKRKILTLLIKRIEVGTDDLTIVYKVQLPPFAHSPNRGCLQHRLNCLGCQIGRPVEPRRDYRCWVGVADTQISSNGSGCSRTNSPSLISSRMARNRPMSRARV
jgi:site-specific DNA recombinase